MEVNELEIQAQLNDHNQRIHNLETARLKSDHEMEKFSIHLQSTDDKVTELKTAVKEDGEKTRKEVETVLTEMKSNNAWMRAFIDNDKAADVAASAQAEETKRTRIQTIKDILQSIFTLLGSVVAGLLAYQEWIGPWLFK